MPIAQNQVQINFEILHWLSSTSDLHKRSNFDQWSRLRSKLDYQGYNYLDTMTNKKTLSIVEEKYVTRIKEASSFVVLYYLL